MSGSKIGIIMGSRSDWNIVERALNAYRNLDLPCTVTIASAHRTPEAVRKWVEEVEKAGVEVIIAVAGMAAALPGVVASHTLLPVIGVPVESGSLSGHDALYSMVQMPPGVPVATVGINGVKNALILALHVLAIKYPEFKKRLKTFRKAQSAKVDLDRNSLIRDNPRYALIPAGKEKASGKKTTAGKKKIPQIEIIDAVSLQGESAQPLKKPSPVAKSPVRKIAGKKRVLKLDPVNPEYDIIEKTADLILEGGIVAIPTDTVYGLACDSTNPGAVEKLYSLKGREDAKPIPVLIDGMRTFSRLVRGVPPEVQLMLEELWPGALTVVFSKPATMLSAVSPEPSLGIRIPDSTIALSVISMVARPLAVTSANPSGRPPATSAGEVEDYFGGSVNLIIDGGEMRGNAVSTVISVTQEPYTLLREGVLSFDTIKGYLKDLRRL